MESIIFASIALTIFSVGLISKFLENSYITPPMLLVTLGLLIGPYGTGILEFNMSTHSVKIIAEITLILILFTDGANITNFSWKKHFIAWRLLEIGMALSIFIGALIAHLLLKDVLNFWECTLLAAVLTPTDTSLARIGINNSKIPHHISEILSLEGGLNDGLILPIIIFLSVCESLVAGGDYLHFWIVFILRQIGLGLATGFLIGYLGAKLIDKASKNNWITHIFEQLSGVALALLAFAVADLLGGNGLIATFVAGITLRVQNFSSFKTLHQFSQAQSHFFSLIIFVIFGAILIAPALTNASFAMITYALLSLIFVRIVSVTLSLSKVDLPTREVLFIGWMGPRGLASLLLALLMLGNTSYLEHVELIKQIVIITVFLSVFFHGISSKTITLKFHTLN